MELVGHNVSAGVTDILKKLGRGKWWEYGSKSLLVKLRLIPFIDQFDI
jgi:hypothetical protein